MKWTFAHLDIGMNINVDININVNMDINMHVDRWKNKKTI
jgi:hypothetical protein